MWGGAERHGASGAHCQCKSKARWEVVGNQNNPGRPVHLLIMVLGAVVRIENLYLSLVPASFS